MKRIVTYLLALALAGCATTVPVVKEALKCDVAAGLLAACGTPADFKDAYWYLRARLEVYNGLTNLTWVNTFMGNTFRGKRGKHGGPDRWWPTAGDPGYTGVPDDHLVGVDVYNRYTCHGKTWFAFVVRPERGQNEISQQEINDQRSPENEQPTPASCE
jgi:hypothetical protein